VLLDRGLGCSPQLLAHIAQMGWYFVARVPGTVRLRTADGMETPMRHWAPEQGAPSKRVYGAVFKKAGWHTYWVLGYWAEDAREPWLLVSNHPQARVAWYRRRMAIEALFRDIKSGGWDFGRCRLRVCERIERFWWVLALALVWAWVCGHRGWVVGWVGCVGVCVGGVGCRWTCRCGVVRWVVCGCWDGWVGCGVGAEGWLVYGLSWRRGRVWLLWLRCWVRCWRVLGGFVGVLGGLQGVCEVFWAGFGWW